MDEVASANHWVQWMSPIGETRGYQVISVRAIGRTGAVQTDKRAAPEQDGATGYHHRRISVS